MGFFAEIASEARRSMAAPPAVPAPVPVAAPEAPAVQPVPAPPAPAGASSPPQAPPKTEPAPSAHTPPPPELKLSVDQAPDDTAARQAHEAAEAKRQAALDRIKAMNDADLLSAAVGRVAADTERLTHRSMKTAVAEFISNKCREDAAFAMLVMDPDKSMIHCFQYINRMAKKFIEDAIKAENPNPESGIYGDDVPDDLVFFWATRYFENPDAKEDKENEEKFVPKPYIPPARKASKAQAAKGKSEKKKPAGEKPGDAGGSMEQISLM